MEAPVPASSLIHSATLVSAGIFLLLRFSVLFELSNVAFPIIGIVGSVTAFYGGLTSMYQSDTKKNISIFNYQSLWFFNGCLYYRCC
jgi:NADH-quinone oxidoreductase subunit L